MRIHILGIGGTFMGGVALLARDLGHEVSGADVGIYPPMSTQLERQGIKLMEGYDPAQLDVVRPELVIIGNALSRGNALVEAVLDRNLRYTSGAQWIAEQVLPGRWVLAVAGTHGKTTTASMLAWILEHAGHEPGFLIGGVPENFGVSARLGRAPYFVIEADEYDTAFFDKRSKFVHYRPRTAILNNLEYDHADIFPDLAAITLQFHHFLRTVPGSGRLVLNAEDENLSNLLAMGCWTPVEYFSSGAVPETDRARGRSARKSRTARKPSPKPDWRIEPRVADGSRFQVLYRNQDVGEVAWGLLGRHNLANAVAAIAAAEHAGVPSARALAALAQFRNVKRRLELRGTVRGITVYDDFAHHPTAISATLEALRARVGNARILAVLELRSNTMRMGVHRDTLAGALARADRVLMLKPGELNWNLDRVTGALDGRGQAYPTVEEIIDALRREARAQDHILIMSNGGFGNIHARLLEQLRA